MKNKPAMLLFLLLQVVCCGWAQLAPVDVANSRLIVRVFRSGLFAGFGHDHEISAPLSGGNLDPKALRADLHFDARKMQVLDPDASAKDRTDIQSTMLGNKVLDAERFPEITFISRRVVPTTEGAYTVEGELNLHGMRRLLTVPVSLNAGRYIGTTKLKQSEFGIKPVKVLGGTVKVKDEVQITFEIVPLRLPSGQ